MNFSENLKKLASIDHLVEIQLIDEQGCVAASIPNLPGKAGSLRVYAELLTKHGAINTAAAHEGLVLFAEHTEEARSHPGSHPNIDRLLEVIATKKGYQAKLISI